MYQKSILRKKYLNLRKRKYCAINKEFFDSFLSFVKSNFKKKNLNLALYYPTSFEIDVLKILENKSMIDKNILLPVIEKNNVMNFFSWKKNNVLLVNKFGILEPVKSKIKIPDIILVPILAFDRNKCRLGYGKGFYDRYLNKYLKKFSNILTVGVAFSFQKHHKLPIDKNDVKLDYILTEKGVY
tara:strand:- start:482 stop:1033 length:552 start_codon:yes stop_codon:yes gene_type:complete